MNARPPIIHDEDQRLESLHRLLVLGSEPEPLFDTIARNAAEICQTPIALITLIDADRQWLKANHGAQPITHTPRSISFCTYTIAGPNLFQVPDADADERFASNPLVTGPLGVRFYAGVPLALTDGQRVGTLCVIDHCPRQLDDVQTARLQMLATMTVQALEMRRDLIRRTCEVKSSYEASLKRSEAIHRAMIQQQTELVSLSDRNGTLLYINDAYERHFNRRDLVGSSLYQGVDALHVDDVRRQMADVFRTGRAQTRDFRTQDATGRARWVSWTHSLHLVEGEEPLMLSVGRDISDEVRFQEEQLRQATILRSIAESIPAAVAVVGPDAKYRFANRAFNEEVPRDGLSVEGRSMREVLGEDLWRTYRSYIDKALAGERVVFEMEPAERNRQQHLSISYIPVIPAGGAPDGFVTIVHDVTRQKHEENRLRHLSQRDPLTGLLNRTGLEMYLENGLYDPTQDKARLGLLYIDLDRFKPVNDTYGHPVGDELLKQFAERLSRLVRPTDAVVRHGGDEFAVVLQNMRDVSSLANVADKIVAMSSTPFLVADQHLSIGASVGFALGIDEAGGWTDLMKRADDMLYQAKAHGRGRRMGEAC